MEALLPQARDREIASGGLIQLKLDVAGFKNLAHLRLHHSAGQPVLWDSEIQHSSCNWRRLEDGDRVPHQSEVVRRGQTDWSSANNSNFERKLFRWLGSRYSAGT